MELWQIIVALIQGLVEWLPISSEGQVVLFLYNFTPVPSTEEEERDGAFESRRSTQ